MNMDIPLKFLHVQQVLTISCHDKKGVWAAPVYVGVEGEKIYFISPKNAKHSKMILKDPNVAFTAAWFSPKDHRDRKGVQGLGTCRLADTEDEIAIGVWLHNQSFHEFKDKVTVEWVHNNEWGSSVWVLTPSYIKFWDDARYGDEESEEFTV